MPAVIQNLVPEARVEQVQYGMLGTTYIQIDWHPGFFFGWIAETIRIARIDEAQEVPTRTGP